MAYTLLCRCSELFYKFSLSLLHICLRAHSLNLGKMELLIPHLALTSYRDVTEIGAINVFVIHNAAGSVTVAVLKLYLKGVSWRLALRQN